MSESQNLSAAQFDAFLRDLVALCRQHRVAIVNNYEEFEVISWGGYEVIHGYQSVIDSRSNAEMDANPKLYYVTPEGWGV